ncbi:PH domain-containing protein [Georgenia subflava]|uniref:PH domain-containing protein n=1 Tax=Georgenia subflava TaxID=1622177 RepID=A0A6N7EJD0_9MICO|nr:PH domain-containing protein [Georgenia subflava]MPV37148.1 PH domain-containing protein [Georgenia subflava]
MTRPEGSPDGGWPGTAAGPADAVGTRRPDDRAPTPGPSPHSPHHAEWTRLDPLTLVADGLTVTALAVAVAVPTGIVIALVDSLTTALVWVLPAAVVTAACGFVGGWLRHRTTRYLVEEHRMRLHSGVVVKKRRSLHRDRIRTVDVTADPVLRILGLARVQIGTGEQSGEEGSINLSPIPRGDAERLHSRLLGRADGDGAHDDVAHPAIATFDPRWLRYVPLTWTPFVIAGACYALAGQTLGNAGQGQQRIIDWFTTLVGDVGWLPVLAVALAGPALVGLVGALLIHVELWWNYRLERETGTLRVRRGLLTTRSTSVQESRLRGIALVEPLGARLAGAAQLDAVASGLRRPDENGKQTATDNKTLLPLAPRGLADDVAATVLREALSPTAVTGLTPHPPAARSKRIRWAFGTVVGYAVVGAVLGVWLTPTFFVVAGVGVVVLTPALVVLAVDAARSLGHRLDEDYLVTRSGTFQRSTVALQRTGIVGWNVRQSWFQRRAGLATITATTAAGSGGYAMRDVDAGEGLLVAVDAVPDLLEPFLAR